MMIDIFQYSNMYTLRKNIQWLADEPHVREECGPYVTKPGMHRCSLLSFDSILTVLQGELLPTGPDLCTYILG
jgi:hypothetical protein